MKTSMTRPEPTAAAAADTTPAAGSAAAATVDAAAAALGPTSFIDSDHPAVRAFATEQARGTSVRERAVSLYLAVRDGFRYDPYRVDMTPAGLRASTVLANGYGWCVPKAVLLAAACRCVGIPARLGYADVRNHLSTERMREVLKTDLFIWHGYTDIQIEGRWLKATPAFNLQLCERFGLLPLEFDGTADSIYHPYDRAGNRHMEYVRQRGSFDDLPLAQMLADFAALYPGWGPNAGHGGALAKADFLADVAKEVS
jgi:transglutaminase-like putative cysteine protease